MILDDAHYNLALESFLAWDFLDVESQGLSRIYTGVH